MAQPENIVWRRRYMVSTHTGKGNPLFPEKRRTQNSHLARNIAFGLVSLCVGAALWWLFFGPTLRLGIITVNSNKYVTTEEVIGTVSSYWGSKRLLFIPKNNYFTFSTSEVEATLEEAYGKDHALESIEVTKHLPSRIDVTIHERTPNLLYNNGGVAYLLDRNGIVVSDIKEGMRLDPSFPTLYDQTTRTTAAGKQMVGSALVEFLFSVEQVLRTSTDIPIEFFYVPPVTCKVFLPVVEEEQEENTNSNTNVATNTSNTNASKNTNSNANTNSNTNTSSNRNTAPVGERVEQVCDKDSEALKNIDLRVKSTEDWEMYFRTDMSADEQVQRLLRVLRERSLDRARLDYIDLRFGEQIIIK